MQQPHPNATSFIQVSDLGFKASSVLDVDWRQLAEIAEQPPVVMLDYDQAAALATNRVTDEVREGICAARELGHIAAFGLASDNPFVGMLSGMRSHADYIFTPYFERGRIITKTNPKFYERILRVANLDSSSIFMIGHHEQRDIAIPQSLGIRTVEIPPLGTLADGVKAHRGRRFWQPLTERFSEAA